MDRVQLCKEIESAINNEYRYLYHEDNLSEVHSDLFPNYDKHDYVCIFHEGLWLTKEDLRLLVDTPMSIEEVGEIEIDVRDIVSKYNLSSDDVGYLRQEYCYVNGFCYLSVQGFYAVMSIEDYEEYKDAYEFHEECLPFTEE